MERVSQHLPAGGAPPASARWPSEAGYTGLQGPQEHGLSCRVQKGSLEEV